MSTLAEDQKKTLDALKAASELQTEVIFMKQHPELSASEAHWKMNWGILTNYLGDLPVTIENLTASLEYIADKLQILDEQVVRARFIETIVENAPFARQTALRKELCSKLKVSPIHKNTPLGQVIEGTNRYATGTLQHQAEQAESKAELRGKSKAELQAIVKGGRQTHAAGSLPAHITPDIIRKAAPEEIRRFAKMAGGGSAGFAAVTARLQGRG